MSQHGALQIETLFFEVSKHFFDPHSSAIRAHGQGSIGQIGCQTPGLLFADLPVDQSRDRLDRLLGQVGLGKPGTLPATLHEILHSLPAVLFIDPQTGTAFLAQNVEPMPCIQLLKDRN